MLRSFCDGTVFGDRLGADRPALLALHGWGRDRSDLTAAVAGYDALNLDLPGFGASPLPPAAWDGAEYAEQVSRVLDEATDEPVVVLGHSFGGRVATCLAAAHPGQVAGLVLTGVPLLRTDGPPARSPWGYRLVKSLHRAHLLSDDALERARRKHGSADYRNATGVIRDVLVISVNETYADQLAHVQAPVELVWGEADTAAPLATARRAEQILAGAGAPVRLTVVAAGTHDTPIRQPEALRAALDRLLLEHYAVRIAGTVLLLVAAGVTSVRWLRVAQREHYLAGSATRFAWRWLVTRPVNLVLGLVTAALIVAGVVVAGAWIPAAVGLALFPLGLGLRGHTSKLAWTRRLRTLAAVTAALALVVVVVAWLVGAGAIGVAVVALAAPGLVDLAAWILAPVERRLLDPFVTRAKARLAQVAPDVVAITGSYGKTTTKGYLKALLAQQFEVCASPASYNNTAGLARTINEHLHPGADVLIAEMGMYDVGEIAEMCSWIEPRVGVITAIGPVHLERLGTIERVVQAKREILDGAEVAVLNVDDPRLAAVADELETNPPLGTTVRRIIRCGSAGDRLDASVVRLDPAPGSGEATGTSRARIQVGDTTVEVAVAEGTHLTNLACALGAAVAMGLDPRHLAAGVAAIEAPDHRGTVEVTAAGVSVIDDTFNSNPMGAQRGLDALSGLPAEGPQGQPGRRVVVTPGMVELGPRQDPENEQFARAAAQAADTLIVVKRTNRRALVRGAAGGRAQVLTVDDRDQAVAWVRDHLSAGDAVLYENDLPDHFV